MLLDYVGIASRFEILVTLLLGIFALLGIVGRIAYKVTSAVYQQLAAIRSNTLAMGSLTESLTNLEISVHERLDLVEQKIDAVDLAGTKGLHHHLSEVGKQIKEVQGEIRNGISTDEPGDM